MTDSAPPSPVPGHISSNALDANASRHDPNFEEPESSSDEPSSVTYQKHSALGIASFVIAVLVGGLNVILTVVIATNMAHSGERNMPLRIPDNRVDLESKVMAGGASWICLNCMSIPLCLVGVAMGFVGLIAHRGQNHVFTWLGLLGNGVVILSVVGLYVLVNMLPP
jgi:hypothetical protein